MTLTAADYTTPSAGSGQAGNAYLHLPGVIVAEKAGETRYLPGDDLGSARQAIDELGARYTRNTTTNLETNE